MTQTAAPDVGASPITYPCAPPCAAARRSADAGSDCRPDRRPQTSADLRRFFFNFPLRLSGKRPISLLIDTPTAPRRGGTGPILKLPRWCSATRTVEDDVRHPSFCPTRHGARRRPVCVFRSRPPSGRGSASHWWPLGRGARHRSRCSVDPRVTDDGPHPPRSRGAAPSPLARGGFRGRSNRDDPALGDQSGVAPDRGDLPPDRPAGGPPRNPFRPASSASPGVPPSVREVVVRSDTGSVF